MGEGAGYGGGIMSCALDGIRIANIIDWLKEQHKGNNTMKTYNKEKHFDLDYFRAKGMAFFDTLDFSEVDNDEIKAIIECGLPEVEFYQCTFKDLDLSRTIFKVNLKFMQCEFTK